MRLINPKVEILHQELGVEGIAKQIERVGRTCYKSEDKIAEGTAKTFVDRMIKSNHLAMCEHGTIYIGISDTAAVAPIYEGMVLFYEKNPYSKVIITTSGHIHTAFITTNLRVLAENNRMRDLKYHQEPTRYHAKRVCMKFTTSIGVSREFNRHRAFSIAEQSTRYCNYTKDKFNDEVTFIIPSWLDIPTGQYVYWDGDWCDIDKMKIQMDADQKNEANILLHFLQDAEDSYKILINKGWKPQQAREVLPLSTATEVVYTGFLDDWKHFFDLRYREITGAAHPNARQVAARAHNLILKELDIDL